MSFLMSLFSFLLFYLLQQITSWSISFAVKTFVVKMLAAKILMAKNAGLG